MSGHKERVIFSGLGGPSCSIKVEETRSGLIKASLLDSCGRFSSTLLTPEEAQELASRLSEVADIVRSRGCDPGKVLVTADQLRSAPYGTVLLSGLKTAFTKTGAETLRGASDYYRVREAARVFGPFTVLYNPEVAE